MISDTPTADKKEPMVSIKDIDGTFISSFDLFTINCSKCEERTIYGFWQQLDRHELCKKVYDKDRMKIILTLICSKCKHERQKEYDVVDSDRKCVNVGQIPGERCCTVESAELNGINFVVLDFISHKVPISLLNAYLLKCKLDSILAHNKFPERLDQPGNKEV